MRVCSRGSIHPCAHSICEVFMMMKRVLALLAALMMMTFALAESQDTVIATVNGESLLYADYATIESAYLYQYEAAGVDLTNPDTYAYLQDLALTYAIEQMLLKQDMRAQGCYDFTEEEEAYFQQAGTAAYSAALEDVKETLRASGIAEDELEVYALAYAKSLNVTEQVYVDYFREQYAAAKYYAWLTRDNPVTDEDVQAEYQARVEESRMLYETDATAFDHAVGNGVWYFPEGYRTVQQIYLSTEGETEAEKLASVQSSVDEIYARLEKGDAFADLVAEYSTDPNPSGYQVHRDSVAWDDSFIAAAFADDMTQPGCWGQPLVSYMGVHILYYVEDIASGAVPLTDELAEALRAVIYTERYTAAQAQRINELADAAQITIY